MLNTFNLAELLVFALLMWTWVTGSAYLIWARFAKRLSISKPGIMFWLVVSVLLILGKLLLVEYLNYLSTIHGQTEFWTRTSHLLWF